MAKVTYANFFVLIWLALPLLTRSATFILAWYISPFLFPPRLLQLLFTPPPPPKEPEHPNDPLP